MNENIKNEVKDTKVFYGCLPQDVEDTIKNGVKETFYIQFKHPLTIEDTIQNGVKETTPGGYLGFISRKGKRVHQFEAAKQNNEVEEVIEDGVKDTKCSIFDNPTEVKNTIQNGIRHVEIGWAQDNNVEDVIEDGIIDTQDGFSLHEYRAEEVIKDGIKHTDTIKYPILPIIDEVIEYGVIKATTTNLFLSEGDNQITYIENVIKEGIKMTRGIDININIINDTIQNGIKKTECFGELEDYEVQAIIEDGVKETYYDEGDSYTDIRVEDTIEKGVKVTYSDMVPKEYDWRNQFIDDVEDAIQNGVKETKDGLSNRLPNPVGDVIENGIKQIKSVSDKIGDVLDSSIGVHTYADEYTQNSWVNTVLENGIKGTYAWDDDILGEPDKLPKVINEGDKTEKF